MEDTRASCTAARACLSEVGSRKETVTDSTAKSGMSTPKVTATSRTSAAIGKATAGSEVAGVYSCPEVRLASQLGRPDGAGYGTPNIAPGDAMRLSAGVSARAWSEWQCPAVCVPPGGALSPVAVGPGRGERLLLRAAGGPVFGSGGRSPATPAPSEGS